MNSTKNYLFYALLLFGTLLFISHIDYRIEIFAKQDARVWEWITIKQLLYIPIGVVLAVPHLFKNWKENRVWKVDFKRFLIFGLPALYLTFSFTIHVYLEIPQFIMTGTGLYKIAAIFLGYIIATSLYKVSNDK